MHPALRQLAHRPWPLPASPWILRQSWLDLAFIHYRVSADQLRPRLPRGIRVQEFDGSAWLGLVPFRMHDVAPRGLPAVPGISHFPELNVRTYVESADGKPGVWFFSLDAASRPTTHGGRLLFGLPYFRARMTHRRKHDWHVFLSDRLQAPAAFRGRYRPLGPPSLHPSGSFAHWASERYCLYSEKRGQLLRVEVHHAPWPLAEAEVIISENTLFSAANLTVLDVAPICHFSPGVHVVSYPAENLAPASR